MFSRRKGSTHGNRRHFSGLALGLGLTGLPAWAQVKDLNDAINKAGRQRMLSRRAAKAYMALALQAGLRPPIAAMAAILASSVTTPIGWVIAHAIGESGHGVMQAMFAASAGLLLYVGWHLIAGGWRALRAKGSV